MSKEKLCPLNSMDPCIGEKCAWHLPAGVGASQGTLTVTTDFKSSIDVMCAVNIGATAALQLLVSNQLDAALLSRRVDNHPLVVDGLLLTNSFCA